LLFSVRVGTLLKTYLHDNALFAHFHDHVERVLLGVVQHLHQGHEIWVIELLHNGDFLLDQLKGIVFFGGGVSVQRRVEAYACGERSPPGAGPAKEVRLCAFPQSRL
jgi:hypothetical protein